VPGLYIYYPLVYGGLVAFFMSPWVAGRWWVGPVLPGGSESIRIGGESSGKVGWASAPC
jgi:hypothetical protein